MDLEKNKISTIPDDPGIYIFKNKENEILYVGKAKNLKKRIKSYFSKSRDSRMNIDFLMKETESFDFISTKTEDDALILENDTIKKRQPKYNVLLKDDKTYASIRIEIQKDYPRISMARKCNDKNSIYLGPFKSSDKLYKTKRLLRKIFGIRNCTDNKFNMHRKRACIYKDIGMCIGPCDDHSLNKIYSKNISLIKDIFKGKVGELKKQINEKMNLMSREERFEEAAFYRDQLNLVSNPHFFEAISTRGLKNTDIIGLYVLGNKIQIIILFLRGGCIIDKADLYVESKTNQINIEIYQLISQFYSQKTSAPKTILLPLTFPYVEELKKDLFSFSLSNTKIEVVQRGRNIELIDLAIKNAQNQIKRNVELEKEINLRLNKIKEIMDLKNTPKRIECFDISNLQGTNSVASMITFINGKPQKSLYRKFKILTKGPNDYAMMEEVVSRRLNRIGEPGWEKPDLILIDGGKGHLNRVLKLAKGIVNIASIAKPTKSEQIDKIYLPNKKKPVNFNKYGEELRILINARDEAHRFAVQFHKSKRKQSMFVSDLDNIYGIGKKTKNKLIKKFGDINSIINTPESELRKLGLSRKVIDNLKSRINNGQ